MINKMCDLKDRVDGMEGAVQIGWYPFKLPVGAPFTSLTLFPVQPSNHMSGKLWSEISYPSQTSKVKPLNFENG